MERSNESDGQYKVSWNSLNIETRSSWLQDGYQVVRVRPYYVSYEPYNLLPRLCPRSRVVGGKIIVVLPRPYAERDIQDVRIAAVLMTSRSFTPPLPNNYVDTIRESCRELREAQNIWVRGNLLDPRLHAYQDSTSWTTNAT